ncbi:unnamed protein product, partial [Prunus brigantina]
LVDRISNLSHEIADNILAFLVIEDLTRFSCLQKMQRVYLSTPSLNFVGYYANLLTCEKLLKLMSSLDRLCLEKAELFLMPEVDDVKILSEVLCSENRVEALVLNKETTYH